MMTAQQLDTLGLKTYSLAPGVGTSACSAGSTSEEMREEMREMREMRSMHGARR
jgi:hypothetical protein